MQKKQKTKRMAAVQAAPEFIAAVRYKDGRKEIFYVRNADDFADARSLIFADLMQAKTILLALRTASAEATERR